MSGVGADGRLARGTARRTQLLEAAVRIIARDGVSGITHRAVAAEAGGSAASVSYHFSTLDELLAQALQRGNDALAAELDASSDASLGALARLLADEHGERRSEQLVEYELYLLAARRPEFVPAATAWLDVVAERFAPGLRGAERQGFLAMVEGLYLHALLMPATGTAARIEASLRAAWPTLDSDD